MLRKFRTLSIGSKVPSENPASVTFLIILNRNRKGNTQTKRSYMADYWSPLSYIMSYNTQCRELSYILRALKLQFQFSFARSCNSSLTIRGKFNLMDGFQQLACVYLYRLAWWTSFQSSHSGNACVRPARSWAGSRSWRSRCSDTFYGQQTVWIRFLFPLEWGRWQLRHKTKTKAWSVLRFQTTHYILQNKTSWLFVSSCCKTKRRQQKDCLKKPNK